MKLVVGYLATPGGADAVALGVRLARTLGAELELRLVVEADDVTTPRVTVDESQDYYNGHNAIDIDREMTELSRAVLSFQFSARATRGAFESLQLAIKGMR